MIQRQTDVAKKGVHLRLCKEVREELFAAAEDELRHPNLMLNVLLAWALEQRALLNFDISKLAKVHLSLLDDGDGAEPWNNVVSGLLLEGSGENLAQLLMRRAMRRAGWSESE